MAAKQFKLGLQSSKMLLLKDWVQQILYTQ
jgi:hypothetical protein